MRKHTRIIAMLLVFALVLSLCAYAYDCSDKFKTCPMTGFSDLSGDIWCHEGLDFVLSRGYMIGKTETQFVPNGSMTRAMIVTVLYRIAADYGLPGDKALYLPFSDVGRDAWYYNELCWAYKQGIAKGFSDTEFAPNRSVTREQITLFLSRFAAFKGESVSPNGNIGIFSDVASLSYESRRAISWAVGEGILYGYSNGEFRPKNPATRAHFAVMLQRWLDEEASNENVCTEHSYGLKEVTLKPGCTQNGRYEQICTVCGHKKIEVIPATGHSYSEKRVGKAASCTQTGTYVKVCVNCGDEIVVDTIPITYHNYVESIVRQPSCTETGLKQKTCTGCGRTMSEEIPMTAHVFSNGRCSCGAYEKTATKIVSLSDGDKVIIYNPACGAAIGTESANNKLACIPVSASGEALVYARNAAIAVLTAEKSGSGFYLKADNGKYLATASDGNALFFSTDKTYALWMSDGGRIRNAAAASGDSAQYIECYADCFNCYGYSTRYADRYTMELYKVS